MPFEITFLEDLLPSYSPKERLYDLEYFVASKDKTRNIKQEPYSPTQRKKSRFLNVQDEHEDLGDISWMEVDFSKEET